MRKRSHSFCLRFEGNHAIEPGVCPDKLRSSAIFHSIRNGNYQQIAALIEKTDVELQNGKNKTLLMVASDAGKLDVINLLISKGADARACDQAGNTALILACVRGYEDIARVLAPHSDINHQNSFGWSALMLAAIAGTAQLCCLLLSYGAEPLATDSKHRTPLMKAVRHANKETFDVLLPVSTVDAQDDDGDTALIKAARYGQDEMIKKLLAKGSNPRIRDKKGETAYDKAVKKGNTEAMTLLELF